MKNTTLINKSDKVWVRLQLSIKMVFVLAIAVASLSPWWSNQPLAL